MLKQWQRITSDGILAPMFYMVIGGPVLGYFYKAVNTMDSMVGYKNDKFLYFGRAAAKFDDVMNFLPSRISGILMVLAAPLVKLDGKNAWKIFKRDRLCHASPNSAQTESVMAGALQVQLAGDAWYFGKKHEKPTIGDPIPSGGDCGYCPGKPAAVCGECAWHDRIQWNKNNPAVVASVKKKNNTDEIERGVTNA